MGATVCRECVGIEAAIAGVDVALTSVFTFATALISNGVERI